MSRRPDVSILLDHFGHGGVERVACHLANGLASRGWRVEFVVLREGGPGRALLNDGVSIQPLGSIPGLARGARMIAAVPRISNYLRLQEPRLFHSPGNHTLVPAFLAAALSRYRGAFVPKLTNPVEKAGLSPGRLWLRKTLYRRALLSAERVLVLSPGAISKLSKIETTLSSRASFVHNPYVSDDLPQRASKIARSEPALILCVGRLCRQKNQKMLLRAAARLQNLNWKVRFCGTGTDLGSLVALSHELGIADRVEFAGFVSDLEPHYREATMLAQPSRWEDLPASLLEAIAHGCPVVATASSPAVTELLSEFGAHKALPLGSEEKFAAALRAGIEGRLPHVPPSATSAYSFERSCDEHAALFTEVLADHQPSDVGLRGKSRSFASVNLYNAANR